MNQSKTFCAYVILLVLALNHTTYTTTKKMTLVTTEHEEINDNLDTLFDDEPDAIDNAQTQHLVEQSRPLAVRAENCTPQQSIDFLLTFNIDQILQEDLYCHTNLINTRSLLDEPLFLTRLMPQPHPWYASVDLFWNETDHANFTKHSDKIDSYLALNNEELLQMLPTAFDCQKYALTVFPTLAKGRLEERRIGTMLQAGYTWKRLTTRAMLPLYYLERNYEMQQEDKDALMVQFGEITEDEQSRYQKDHLISDKLGFGDLRLYGDISVLQRRNLRLNAGPLITLPTAFALVKGIQGSTFKPICPRPTVNFEEICACVDIESFTNLGLQSLDTLSAIILEQPLGNRRHIGLGGFVDWEHKLSSIIHRPWTERFLWKNYVSFEYLMPGNETRFFIKPANEQEFNSRNFHDEAQAVSNLHFLETDLINTLFPFNFTTRVQPGCVFWWDSQWAYQGKNAGFSCGLDFWLQSKEKLSRIQSCGIPCQELAVSTARAPLAYQTKVVGSFTYTVTRPKHLWTLGIGADKTFLRAGIGKDFTANAFLHASF